MAAIFLLFDFISQIQDVKKYPAKGLRSKVNYIIYV